MSSTGLSSAEVVEVPETATLVAFVATGIGWALVPETVQSLALEHVTYRSLADVDTHTELVLSTRSEALSPTVLHAADMMADVTMACSPMSPFVDGYRYVPTLTLTIRRPRGVT